MTNKIPKTWKGVGDVKCHFVGIIKDANYLDENDKPMELVVFKHWLKRKAYWRYEVQMKRVLLYTMNFSRKMYEN